MLLTLSTFVVSLLTVLFVIVCVLMMFVILIQKPRGGGLSGAFGGAGGGAATQAAFGARTGDVLTWITVGFFVAFLLLAMGLTWTVSPPEQVTREPTAAPVQTPADAEPGAGGVPTPGQVPGTTPEATPSPAPGPGEQPTDGQPADPGVLAPPADDDLEAEPEPADDQSP